MRLSSGSGDYADERRDGFRRPRQHVSSSAALPSRDDARADQGGEYATHPGGIRARAFGDVVAGCAFRSAMSEEDQGMGGEREAARNRHCDG